MPLHNSQHEDNYSIQKTLKALIRSYEKDSGTNFIDDTNLPVYEKIKELIDHMLEIVFPGYTGRRFITRKNVPYVIGDLLYTTATVLDEQICRAFKHQCRLQHCTHSDCQAVAYDRAGKLISRLPEIRKMLTKDVEAAYQGDPAAKSQEEVVISYPGITAVAVYRLSHELYTMDVPLIPRMMSEIAHTLTGIDIHPGATIGESFFIDHGTGVVIGETTVIGNRVKIYQGVTLGALSFSKDEQGKIKKGGKRHPTIEDDVTIYAEATILGSVVIGKNSVIGGNVWLKESIPPNTVISMANVETVKKSKNQHTPG